MAAGAAARSAGTVMLASGQRMPLIGLGTWKSPQGKTAAAVKAAVRAGCRLIDTANDYNNEREIGQALRELVDAGEVRREELFVQCKLWNANHRPANAWLDLRASLEDLQLDYIDCYVIHWPMACPALPDGSAPGLRKSGAFPGNFRERQEGGCWMFPHDDEGRYVFDKEAHYVETWHTMEQMVDEGLVRSIGLSNFNKRQVGEVVAAARKHPVSVNQCESHPYLAQRDLRDFCAHHNVVFQAYSPLGSFDRPKFFRRDTDPAPVFENETILSIAAKHGRTPAQVVLRWHVEHGGSAVPKSVTPERIAQNTNVFDFALDAEDMAALAKLNVGWRHLLWPDTSGHPNYPFKDELPLGYTPGKVSSTTEPGA